jgi:hypothetical protein
LQTKTTDIRVAIVIQDTLFASSDFASSPSPALTFCYNEGASTIRWTTLVSDQPLIEEIWVNTIEGAEITGYNVDYLRQIAYKIWRQPEDERAIKVRYRARRYELWLPDLIVYIEAARHGPQPKRTPKT